MTAYHPQLRTVHDVVAFHAGQRPDHPAVHCEDRTVSYAQLHRSSNRTAHALRRAGVTAGHRVAYLGKESEHYYDVLFACAKTGTVLVPINWRLRAGEIRHIMRDSGSTVLFCDEDLLDTVDALRPDLPELREVVSLAGFTGWQADEDADLDPSWTEEQPWPRCTPAARPATPRVSCWPTAASSRCGTRSPPRAWTGSTGGRTT